MQACCIKSCGERWAPTKASLILRALDLKMRIERANKERVATANLGVRRLQTRGAGRKVTMSQQTSKVYPKCTKAPASVCQHTALALPCTKAPASVCQHTALALPCMFAFYDSDWSFLNHGVAKRRRCDLGNLNPIWVI